MYIRTSNQFLYFQYKKCDFYVILKLRQKKIALNEHVNMEQKAIDRHNDFVSQRKAEIQHKNMLKERESVKKRKQIFQKEYKSVD